jgi:hypothetical protein
VNGGLGNGPGEWIALATNATGLAAAPPHLPAAPAPLVAWQSSSADQARSFLVEQFGAAAFQLRPNGGAGNTPDGAAVALDYMEVRVRYTVPP